MANVVIEALPFDTTQVTSPQNGNNPKWGDPCHPLAAQGHPPTVICKTPPTCIIDSIGGQAERSWEGETAPCLKASHYKFPPVITQAAGFCTEHSAKAYGIGYQEEVAPTLRAGVTPAVMAEVYDARGNGDGKTVNTLTGDHNNRITDYSSVVAGPRLASGREAAGCLMASGYEKLGAQEMFSGDYTVIEEKPAYCLQGSMIGRTDKNGPQGDGVNENVGFTLNTTDRHGVAYATDIGFFTSSENTSPTLLARMYKDPHLVSYSDTDLHLIARRLTPTECARLQGFADRWGWIDNKDGFTDEEYKFWLDVRNTHAAINGKQVKEYTAAQMLNWYNKLWTDSAEYKMWGNGISLPTALYCIQGIFYALTAEEDESWMD